MVVLHSGAHNVELHTVDRPGTLWDSTVSFKGPRHQFDWMSSMVIGTKNCELFLLFGHLDWRVLKI